MFFCLLKILQWRRIIYIFKCHIKFMPTWNDSISSWLMSCSLIPFSKSFSNADRDIFFLCISYLQTENIFIYWISPFPQPRERVEKSVFASLNWCRFQLKAIIPVATLHNFIWSWFLHGGSSESKYVRAHFHLPGTYRVSHFS